MRQPLERKAKLLDLLAHPTEFESVTSAFGGQRSIQLSYGCMPCAGRAPADGRKLLKLGRGRNGGFGGNRGLLKNCRCDGEMTAFARGGELCSQLSIIAKAEPHCGNTDKQGIGKKLQKLLGDWG